MIHQSKTANIPARTEFKLCLRALGAASVGRTGACSIAGSFTAVGVASTGAEAELNMKLVRLAGCEVSVIAAAGAISCVEGCSLVKRVHGLSACVMNSARSQRLCFTNTFCNKQQSFLRIETHTKSTKFQ